MRTGNWLTKRHPEALLASPDPASPIPPKENSSSGISSAPVRKSIRSSSGARIILFFVNVSSELSAPMSTSLIPRKRRRRVTAVFGAPPRCFSQGKVVCFVTGDPVAFAHTAKVIGGVEGEVTSVELSELRALA